jgi:hypothetical protein
LLIGDIVGASFEGVVGIMKLKFESTDCIMVEWCFPENDQSSELSANQINQ